MLASRRQFLAAAAAAGADRDAPLRANYFGTQYYDDKERRELMDVLETRRPFRWYGPGSEAPVKTATFEREFAARMQTRYALAVTSGTAALQIAMAALGVGPGDEVILPAWTWHSCFNAIVLAGALPVFAEIDESFNIDPADIESRITPRTRVILVAHLQGSPADLGRILPIARKHGVKVLEDCAQSVGGSYQGRPLGSYGDMGIYSLQINKTITAGEGGAVATSDPLLFERAARFHDLGGMRPLHEALLGKAQSGWFVGANYRLNEFSAGVLLAQLRKLDRIVGDVRSNARTVYEGVRDLAGVRFRLLPDPAGELGSAVFLGFPSAARQKEFAARMRDEGVPVSPPSGSVILPTQPHIVNKVTAHPGWPSFTSERGKAIQYGAGCCPRTIDILGRFAGPSLDPKYTGKETGRIIAAIRKVWQAA